MIVRDTYRDTHTDRYIHLHTHRDTHMTELERVRLIKEYLHHHTPLSSLLLPLPQPPLSLTVSEASEISVSRTVNGDCSEGVLQSSNLVFSMTDRWNILAVWMGTWQRSEESLRLFFHLLI